MCAFCKNMRESAQNTWLQEEETLLDLIANNTFHLIPLNQLNATFYYINLQNEIVHQINKQLDVRVNNAKSVVEWDALMSFVKSCSTWNDKKYAFEDAALHHITVDYGSVDIFKPAETITSILSNQSIKIDPALAIFHDLSELFVFMREISAPSKSILKTGASKSGSKTKKVRISEQAPIKFPLKLRNANRQTRKKQAHYIINLRG